MYSALWLSQASIGAGLLGRGAGDCRPSRGCRNPSSSGGLDRVPQTPTHSLSSILHPWHPSSLLILDRKYIHTLPPFRLFSCSEGWIWVHHGRPDGLSVRPELTVWTDGQCASIQVRSRGRLTSSQAFTHRGPSTGRIADHDEWGTCRARTGG